jgi:hypothetical protein
MALEKRPPRGRLRSDALMLDVEFSSYRLRNQPGPSAEGWSRHPGLVVVNETPHAVYLAHLNVAASTTQSPAEVVKVQ